MNETSDTSTDNTLSNMRATWMGTYFHALALVVISVMTSLLGVTFTAWMLAEHKIISLSAVIPAVNAPAVLAMGFGAVLILLIASRVMELTLSKKVVPSANMMGSAEALMGGFLLAMPLAYLINSVWENPHLISVTIAMMCTIATLIIVQKDSPFPRADS